MRIEILIQKIGKILLHSFYFTYIVSVILKMWTPYVSVTVSSGLKDSKTQVMSTTWVHFLRKRNLLSSSNCLRSLMRKVQVSCKWRTSTLCSSLLALRYQSTRYSHSFTLTAATSLESKWLSKSSKVPCYLKKPTKNSDKSSRR